MFELRFDLNRYYFICGYKLLLYRVLSIVLLNSLFYIFVFTILVKPLILTAFVLAIASISFSIIVSAPLNTGFSEMEFDLDAGLSTTEALWNVTSEVFHNVHFLLVALVFYVCAFLLTPLAIPLMAFGAAFNIVYLHPFITKKVSEYNSLKHGFFLSGVNRVTVTRMGEYKLLCEGHKIDLNRSEARFLYYISLNPTKSHMVKWFVSLKKGFKKGTWSVFPTLHPCIYLMAERDFARFIPISIRNAAQLLKTYNSPESLLYEISKLSEDIKVYRELTSNFRNIRFAGTDAVIDTRYGTVLINLQDGEVLHKKRSICLVTRLTHMPEEGVAQTGPSPYSLKGKRLEILSKLYHLASEEPNVMRLIKRR